MTERNFTVAEKLFIILAWKANGMSMAAAYDSWSDHYCRTNIRQYWKDSSNQLQGWKFDVADFQQLSIQELKFLGFRNWEKNYWLLPLWLVPQVNYSETGWFDLWGKETSFTIETDLDNRGGCIALCFVHEPVAVLPEPQAEPERETLDQMFDDGLDAEAQAFINGMPGDDDEIVVHPLRDDERQ